MNQHTHTYTHTYLLSDLRSVIASDSHPVVDQATLLQCRLHSLFIWEHLENAARQSERGGVLKRWHFLQLSSYFQSGLKKKKTFMRLKKIKSGVSERIWKKWEKKKYHDSVGFLTSWQESFHPDSPAALTWCTCSSNDNTEKAFKNGSKISSCLVSGEDTQTSYALRRKVLRDAFWESMFVAKVKSSSVQIWENTCAYMDGVKTEWSDSAAGVRQLLYTIYHTHTYTHMKIFLYTHT